jgi:hypothetical protein
MVSIDGTDISGATIDGTDVSEITIDGDVVWTASADPPAEPIYIGSTGKPGVYVYNKDGEYVGEYGDSDFSLYPSVQTIMTAGMTTDAVIGTSGGIALVGNDGETVHWETDTNLDGDELDSRWDIVYSQSYRIYTAGRAADYGNPGQFSEVQDYAPGDLEWTSYAPVNEDVRSTMENAINDNVWFGYEDELVTTDEQGNITETITLEGVTQATDLAWDGGDGFIVADNYADAISRHDQYGNEDWRWEAPSNTTGRFVACDPQTGDVYAADDHDLVQLYLSDGTEHTRVNNAGNNSIIYDGAMDENGYIYIITQDHDMIKYNMYLQKEWEVEVADDISKTSITVWPGDPGSNPNDWGFY